MMLKKTLSLTVALAAFPAFAQGTFRAPGGLDPNTQIRVSGANTSLGQIGALAAQALQPSNLGQPNGPAKLGADGSLGLIPLGGGMTGSQANAQINANSAGINGEISRATSAESLLVPRSIVGAPSGVSGLDANGNATAPMRTVGGAIAQGSQQWGQSAAMSLLPSDKAAGISMPAAPMVTQNYQWNGDPWVNPAGTMIGGHQPFQGGSLAVYGAPWSYSNVGALSDIEMGNATWADMRSGSGDYDALAQFINASSTAPYYKIGSDFKDDTGASHTLVFDANGVTVSPQLPPSFFSMFNAHGAGGGSGMLVVTNMNASAPTTMAAIPGFPAQPTPNLWVGYITGATQGTSSTHLDMSAGWHPQNAWVGATGQNNNTIPDTSQGLDQVIYSAYTHPMLFIGTYIQAFDQNMKCAINQSGSNPATTLSDSDSPMQSCQANEADFYVPTNRPNGWMHAQGFTADLLTSFPLVSPNSAAFIAQGNWPTAYITGLGTDGREFYGSVLDVGSRRGPSATIGNFTEILEAMQGADAPTDVRSNMVGLRAIQTVGTVGFANAGKYHNPEDEAVHLGAWFYGIQYPQQASDLGSNRGDLIFNPPFAKGGAALCGSIALLNNQNGQSCAFVLGGGQMTINPNQTNTSAALSIAPGGYNGNTAGAFGMEIGAAPTGNAALIGGFAPSNYGNDLLELMIGSAMQARVDWRGNGFFGGNVSGVGFQETLTTPSSSSAPCTAGQFTDDANYHYVCVATNTWKRAALSSF